MLQNPNRCEDNVIKLRHQKATVGNGRDPLLTHYIPKGQKQRYATIGEDGLFFSSSKEGNFQELEHWGIPIEGNTTTFIY